MSSEIRSHHGLTRIRVECTDINLPRSCRRLDNANYSSGSRSPSTSKRFCVGIAVVSHMSAANVVTHDSRFGLPNLRLSLSGRVKPTAGSTVLVGAMYSVIVMSLESVR